VEKINSSVRVWVIMESLQGITEDPIIKSFLKRFPEENWPEMIKKALKCGIHSVCTLQSLYVKENSPHRRMKNEDENKEVKRNTKGSVESLNIPSSLLCTSKEVQSPYLTEQIQQKTKKKTGHSINRIKLSRGTPRGYAAGFDFPVEKKENVRMKSAKSGKNRKSNKKLSGVLKNGSKKVINFEKLNFDELEKSYNKSFNY
jgi:hypothetical protein